MVAKNDITGDVLKNRPTTDKYRDGYEAIFGKEKKPSCTASTEQEMWRARQERESKEKESK